MRQMQRELVRAREETADAVEHRVVLEHGQLQEAAAHEQLQEAAARCCQAPAEVV